MISAYHSHNTRTVSIRGKEVVKPFLVLDYNQLKMGVDFKDQLLHPYLFESKWINKWYEAILQALEHLNSEGRFVKYTNTVECKVPGRHSSDNTVPRLTERHFISKLYQQKKSSPQRWCVVCQKRGKRKDTTYWCNTCDVGLCVECFRDYHTELNF
jgi:hypothetical protein